MTIYPAHLGRVETIGFAVALWAGRFADPFCQPFPQVQKALIADGTETADQQFAVEDEQAREAENIGDFKGR